MKPPALLSLPSPPPAGFPQNTAAQSAPASRPALFARTSPSSAPFLAPAADLQYSRTQSSAPARRSISAASGSKHSSPALTACPYHLQSALNASLLYPRLKR